MNDILNISNNVILSSLFLSCDICIATLLDARNISRIIHFLFYLSRYNNRTKIGRDMCIVLSLKFVAFCSVIITFSWTSGRFNYTWYVDTKSRFRCLYDTQCSICTTYSRNDKLIVITVWIFKSISEALSVTHWYNVWYFCTIYDDDICMYIRTYIHTAHGFQNMYYTRTNRITLTKNLILFFSSFYILNPLIYNQYFFEWINK